MDIHFIHVRSPHEDAMPLIMTHGWPGSVIELLETVGPLTDPTAHGGRAEDAFDLVLPSIPGYGFSGEPTELGWDLGRIARAWAELMRRLGYTRYVAQGGDVGAGVTDAMGRQAPEGLIGIHTNLLVPALGGAEPTDTDAGTRGARRDRHVPGDRQRLLRRAGHAAADDRLRPAGLPVALAAWMLDHDTDAYYKISRAFVDGQPSGNLTRDHILDNITLYWLTGTGASAARSYWEDGADAPARRGRPDSAGRSRSRSASPRSPARSGGRRAAGSRRPTPTLIYFNEVDRGGHFAAWEEPELFPSEIRAAFRSLRESTIRERRARSPSTAPIVLTASRRDAAASKVGCRRSTARPAGSTRAADARGAARARRPRRLLDLHLRQLAAHAAVRARVGRRSTATTDSS